MILIGSVIDIGNMVEFNICLVDIMLPEIYTVTKDEKNKKDEIALIPANSGDKSVTNYGAKNEKKNRREKYVKQPVESLLLTWLPRESQSQPKRGVIASQFAAMMRLSFVRPVILVT